jgi:hypothetical protein
VSPTTGAASQLHLRTLSRSAPLSEDGEEYNLIYGGVKPDVSVRHYTTRVGINAGPNLAFSDYLDSDLLVVVDFVGFIHEELFNRVVEEAHELSMKDYLSAVVLTVRKYVFAWESTFAFVLESKSSTHFI